jgi:hypothetical protein
VLNRNLVVHVHRFISNTPLAERTQERHRCSNPVAEVETSTKQPHRLDEPESATTRPHRSNEPDSATEQSHQLDEPDSPTEQSHQLDEPDSPTEQSHQLDEPDSPTGPPRVAGSRFSGERNPNRSTDTAGTITQPNRRIPKTAQKPPERDSTPALFLSISPIRL